MTGKMMLVLFILAIFCVIGLLTFWETPVGFIFAYALWFVFFLVWPFEVIPELGMPEWLGWLAWVGAWVLLFIIGAVIHGVLSELFGEEQEG